MNTRNWIAVYFLFCPLALWSADEPQDADEEWVVAYQYAVYLLPGNEDDPVATVSELLREKYPRYTVVDALDEPPSTPVLQVSMLEDAQREYTPPDMQLISYFGRSLSREQALAVQESERVLVIVFAHPSHMLATAFLDALQLMTDLGHRHDGLVWDEATREIFTPAAWEERRISTWDGDIPSASDQIVIHAYQDTEHVRAITLGMEKFGLPDIVVNDMSWSSNDSAGNLMNLIAQVLVEGTDFDQNFGLSIDFEEIRHTQVRENALASLLDNAVPRTTLHFAPTEPDEGDPANFLLEIRFDSDPAASTQQEQEALLSSLFGWVDSVSAVVHTQSILDASERAKEKLPLLSRDFNAGLEPGEYIAVKAPFPTPDGGNEWMWVEVFEWGDGKIRGMLLNEPVNVPHLSGGSEVIVDEEDLFDYIRYFPDGTSEGNETGRIMMENQAN